jgi:hypothetical protein
MSHFLCGIISIPIAITTNFVDVINNDMVCKAVRFTNIFFLVVTGNTLFVIGIERYVAVFYPFRVPSRRLVRGFVAAAWIAGGLITLVPSATFSLQIRDIGPDTYTKLCMYGKTVPIYKTMFLGYTIMHYLIPSVILTFASLRILSFLQRRRKTTFPNARRVNSPRLYGTSTFVTLILTVVIPYILFITFSSLNMVLKINLNSTADFVVRRLSVLLAYSNAAVSPTVMLYTMPELKRDFLEFVRHNLGLFPTRRHSNAVVSFHVANECNNLPTLSGHIQQVDQEYVSASVNPYAIEIAEDAV